MPDALLQDCLEIFAHAGSDSESRRILQRYRHELIRRPEIGAELLAKIAAAREEGAVETECDVLESSIEEARMDRENVGPYGAAFLSGLEEALEHYAAKDAITETGTYLLGSCYVRAGLEVPKRLKRSVSGFGARPAATAGTGDLDALLDRLQKEAGGNAYALHMALSELLATLDPKLQGMLIGEMVDRDTVRIFPGRTGAQKRVFEEVLGHVGRLIPLGRLLDHQILVHGAYRCQYLETCQKRSFPDES